MYHKEAFYPPLGGFHAYKCACLSIKMSHLTVYDTQKSPYARFFRSLR